MFEFEIKWWRTALTKNQINYMKRLYVYRIYYVFYIYSSELNSPIQQPLLSSFARLEHFAGYALELIILISNLLSTVEIISTNFYLSPNKLRGDSQERTKRAHAKHTHYIWTKKCLKRREEKKQCITGILCRICSVFDEQ